MDEIGGEHERLWGHTRTKFGKKKMELSREQYWEKLAKGLERINYAVTLLGPDLLTRLCTCMVV